MNKMHIKKGDTVVVLSGKDKGKKGIVLSVLSTNSNLVPYLRQQESRNGVDERSIRFSAMKNIAVVRLQPQFS